MPPPRGSGVVALQPGSRLDRFELVAPVARGGMGEVWRARTHAALGITRDIALKTLLPELAGRDEFRRMFLDEARVTAAITHAHVAQVIDVGECDGRLYLALERVDGP